MKVAKLLLPVVMTVFLRVIMISDFQIGPVQAAADKPADELTVCLSGPSNCAYATIQAAVDAAQPGDLIKIAAGTYATMNTLGGEPQVVFINKPLTLRGGYSTDTWANPDPEANPTTVDAGGQGRGITIQNADGSVFLEGIRVTGGDAAGLSGPGNAGACGGGIFAMEVKDLTLKMVKIYENSADQGAGLFVSGGEKASLLMGTVYSNTAKAPSYDHGGGALLTSGTAMVAVKDSQIVDNTSEERAGGVYILGGEAVLENNLIARNQGKGREGGGVHLRGGKATVTANQFNDNQAHWGAGFYADNGDVTFIRNSFVGNAATTYSGGAVALLFAGKGNFVGNLFKDNQAISRGGGVHLYHVAGSFKDNVFDGNFSGGDGGGLSQLAEVSEFENNVFMNNNAVNHGDGLLNVGATFRMWHTTLSHNQGEGIFLSINATAHMTNTIMANHLVGVLVETDQGRAGDLVMANTLWDNNTTDTQGPASQTQAIAGHAAFAADGYHLTAASDAINAGALTRVVRDIDSERRVFLPDLGADENREGIFDLFLPLVTP